MNKLLFCMSVFVLLPITAALIFMALWSSHARILFIAPLAFILFIRQITRVLFSENQLDDFWTTLYLRLLYSIDSIRALEFRDRLKSVFAWGCAGILAKVNTLELASRLKDISVAFVKALVPTDFQLDLEANFHIYRHNAIGIIWGRCDWLPAAYRDRLATLIAGIRIFFQVVWTPLYRLFWKIVSQLKI